MKFRAEIDVMPHDALLDPQGKAVSNTMKSIRLPEIEGVRIGRHVRLFIDANSAEEAAQKVENACKKLLCNQIMETFSFELHQD